MRCRKGYVAFLVATLVLTNACGDNQDDAGASALLDRVRAEQYRSWERAPGYETRKPTTAPHGDEVDIYTNDVLSEALMSTQALKNWPVGSTIVKDGWADGDLDIIAIMDKRVDGWFWAEYDSDGDADFSGRPDICLDCHESGADSVRAFGFPK